MHLLVPTPNFTSMLLSSLIVLSPALVHSFAFPPAQEALPAVLTVQPDLNAAPSTSAPIITLSDDDDDSPLPVILWHGLGDSTTNEGLQDVASLISEIHPGTYTYLISATESPADDRSASFFGNVSAQIEYVCSAIAQDPILSSAPAVDAIGFSQGGQFLRGAIERCGPDAKDTLPMVRSLITLGSQHNGIAEFQKCKSTTDWVCRAANAVLKSRTVWSEYVQSHLVPAQYYRDAEDYESYLEHSAFLADVNNERALKNVMYKRNLVERLEKFVMVVFEDDVTVIPKESGWFAEVNATTGDVTKLKDRDIYKQDWLGLKEIDERGGLVFDTVEGEHMQLKEKDLVRLFKKYLGPAKETAVDRRLDL